MNRQHVIRSLAFALIATLGTFIYGRLVPPAAPSEPVMNPVADLRSPVHGTHLAQDTEPAPERRTPEVSKLGAIGETGLKSLYLDCARETSENRMDVHQAMFCQAVADHLHKEYFGSDFERLIQWWHSARLEQQ